MSRPVRSVSIDAGQWRIPSRGLVRSRREFSSRAAVLESVRVGRRTWKVAVLVTFPCGVRIVVGPEVASGGTDGGDAEVEVVCGGIAVSPATVLEEVARQQSL